MCSQSCKAVLVLTLLCTVVIQSVSAALDEHEEDHHHHHDHEDQTNGHDEVDEDGYKMPENMRNAENVMSFKPPELNEEESHSSRMPATLVCDGCEAVAFQLTNALVELQKKFGKKQAPESEVIEKIENVCQPATFQEYGVKTMKGENRLSGPGTAAVDEPGMMQGGGRWPVRLATMCAEFFGEVDEYETYEIVYESQGKLDALKTFLCNNEEGLILNTCGQAKRAKKDEL